MKLLSAGFKLNSPKRFCKNICWLFMRGNKFDFDGVVFRLLASEVVVNLEVFGFFVKDWVVTEFNVALVITVDVGRPIILNSKSINNLRIQIASHEH
jgi:hypothetical protein